MHMDQKSKQELRSWIFPILMLIFVTPLGVLLIVLYGQIKSFFF